MKDELCTNIIDVIKEEQIKLGYRKEQIRLYYPLSSLNLILGKELECEDMKKYLEEYFLERKEIFGEVNVSYKGERFCLHLSDTASEYVNNHTEKTGFLYDFIEKISAHDVKINELVDLFHKYSDDVYFEKMENSEFDYLIYFVDGKPDSYWYLLTEEGHHITYHRYTKQDFISMGL